MALHCCLAGRMALSAPSAVLPGVAGACARCFDAIGGVLG
jgi:hypothetical protein